MTAKQLKLKYKKLWDNVYSEMYNSMDSQEFTFQQRGVIAHNAAFWACAVIEEMLN